MASLDELRKQDMLKRAGVQPPAPGLFQRAFPNTSMALNQRSMDIADAQKTGGTGAAVGQSLRTAGAPLIGFLDDVGTGAKAVLDPAAQALKTFATGDATPIGQVSNPLVSAAQPKPATPASPMAPSAGAGRGFVSPPTSAQPASQAASNPLVRQIAPGIFRQGNSFSDTAAGATDGARPAPVSAQNMAAADALAARYQSNPVEQEQAQPGGGLYIGADTGGYGLLDRSRIAQRNAMMDVQQMKPGSGKALAALLQQQTDAPKLDLERQGLAQRGQESAADRQMRSTELMARLGESSADRALRSQELADNSLVNAAKREAMGVETGAAKQLADLRTAYLNAKTPEEQAAASAKINALSGKNQPAEWGVQVTPGVKNIDGSTTEGSVYRFNKATGEVQRVDGGQGQSAQGQTTVKSKAELDKLPSGAIYVGPDGIPRRKP
jgi:hypothetical protein